MKAIRNDESSMYVTLTMTWDEEISQFKNRDC